MTIIEFKNLFFKETNLVLEQDEQEIYFYWTIENILKLRKIEVITNNNLSISDENLNYLHQVLERIKKNEPIQYIFEEAFFYGYNYYVNSSVLVPRQETEQLVEVIENQYDKNSSLQILDICTGSGCIAITLSKIFANANITALDIDTKALEVAKKNNIILNANVNFQQKDILKETLNEKYDLIVSNPPYVRYQEKNEMKPNVLDYEPHIALFVPNDDALVFYERISQLAIEHLNPNGWLFFEINQYLGKETKELIKNFGFSNVEIIQDFRGNDRIIKGQKCSN